MSTPEQITVKVQAPEDFSAASVEGITYQKDNDGFFTMTQEHAQLLAVQGFQIVEQISPEPIPVVAEFIPPEPPAPAPAEPEAPAPAEPEPAPPADPEPAPEPAEPDPTPPPPTDPEPPAPEPDPNAPPFGGNQGGGDPDPNPGAGEP